MKKQLMITASILASFPSHSSETLKISSIDWCPQLCTNGSKDGYVMDTVREIFKNSPYSLDVEVFPWTRAIKNVEAGKSHALLSPAKEEAPGLKFPAQEVGLQRMCFITRMDSKWEYNSPESLSGMTVGMASDTSIEELNSYMVQNPNQFDFLPYGENYIEKNIKKLGKNRIDAFIFTHNSTMYKLNELGLSSDYKVSGCVDSAKIYMAFTPNSADESKVNKMMAYFDHRMQELKASGKIGEIMASYGLEDWQEFL
ncbi:substrate-binding periplasmic protein [Photobacterium alginatilyticum]|uniref:Transporter substrate-binding domain-containing protein n=1 Tax=Photobacterium alginatilyticum TaxID=1775171 RepID=A0ABW9YUF8_9GAMM|nr:transporter substrate-binding domain-containing protein [Photobacterium alginatilyticum]NBI56134.1 transporter substrate-binding domain-containing protein [Photobacterium alginatilyticum]